MPPLDPRVYPYRPDLAAAFLRGKVEATRFAEGIDWQVVVPRAPLTDRPDATASYASELRFGEVFTVYEAREGWVWGQNQTDRYVGYVPAACLASSITPATHRIGVPVAFLYPQPTIKTRAVGQLTLNCAVTVTQMTADFAQLNSGEYIYARCLLAPDAVRPDFAATAANLVGVPYLWGGRTPLGLDCSALVQLSLNMAGIFCPRDSDLQRAEMGRMVSPDGKGLLYQRGDLVFFPGHVGLMLDEQHLVHANAHHMQVTTEPLRDVLVRGQKIIAVRRL